MKKKKEIKIYEYEGTPISFEFEEGLKMINATQMAKPYKKRTNDFLRLSQTKAFIEAMEKRYGISRNEILRVVQAGDAKLQGTWMNERLALKFAAWLDADFELWVYDTIIDLVTNKNEIAYILQRLMDNAKDDISNLRSIKGFNLDALNPMFPDKPKKKK